MRGITKRFAAVTALQDAHLSVQSGEIHALLGENGAGKSTLMHILAGLTMPNSGTIHLNGQPVHLPTPRAARQAGIAMVHQHFTLVPAFTVEENLALDADYRGKRLSYRASNAAQQSLDRAEALGWKLPRLSRVADLPVGAQQRVEIVKALATDARLLIFDEPTAVLAGAEVEELFSVLRLLRDEGHSIILIAHKLAEILAVADRVTVLRQGRNVATTEVANTNAPQLAAWMIGRRQGRRGDRYETGRRRSSFILHPSVPVFRFQPAYTRRPGRICYTRCQHGSRGRRNFWHRRRGWERADGIGGGIGGIARAGNRQSAVAGAAICRRTASPRGLYPAGSPPRRIGDFVVR